ERGEMNEQWSKKSERDRVGQIDALVELRPHLQGRAEEMGDEREQADDEEVCDVRSAPLFEQEVNADAQVNQSDQIKEQNAHRVRSAPLQALQVGDPFAGLRIAALVASFHPITERQRMAVAELAFSLIEVNLDVRGPVHRIEWLTSGCADRQ